MAAKKKTTEDEIKDMVAKVVAMCNDESDNKKSKSKSSSSHGGSGLYFVGFIGALIYWMQYADGFGSVLTGVLKALVWPAYIVYKLLEGFYGVV
ncbi:MAG: hypothetical protein AAF413_02380 [Patescibacteria group bacterium]